MGNISGSSQTLLAPVGNVVGAGVCFMLVKFDSDFIFCSAACTMTNHLYAGMPVGKSIPHTGSV